MKNPFFDRRQIKKSIEGLKNGAWTDEYLETLMLCAQFEIFFDAFSPETHEFLTIAKAKAHETSLPKEVRFWLATLSYPQLAPMARYEKMATFARELFSDVDTCLKEAYGVSKVFELNEELTPAQMPLIFTPGKQTQTFAMEKLSSLGLKEQTELIITEKCLRPFSVVTMDKRAFLFLSADSRPGDVIHEVAHIEHLLQTPQHHKLKPFEKECVALKAEWNFLQNDHERKLFLFLNYTRQKFLFAKDKELVSGNQKPFRDALLQNRIMEDDLYTPPLMSGVYAYAVMEIID